MTALDRVVDLQTGRRAVALRHVPQSLDVFSSHFPRFPVLPGVLILDDLVRVARLALDGFDGEGQHWRLAETRRLRFRHFVGPGDSMEIAISVTAVEGATATCRGTVRVGDKTVTTVQELVLERCEGEAP